MCIFGREISSLISSMCDDGLSISEATYLIKSYVSSIESLSLVLGFSSSIDEVKVCSYLKEQIALFSGPS